MVSQPLAWPIPSSFASKRWRAGAAAMILVAPGAPAWAASRAGFEPTSVTFISASTGWALGTSACGGTTCLALRKTVDGGRHWSPQPLPRSVVSAAGHLVDSVEQQGEATELDVRFANAGNGWIYGELGAKGAKAVPAAGSAVLWSTHAGTSWAVGGQTANYGAGGTTAGAGSVSRCPA